ncbi:hypothetical protein HK101_006893 [Irineochytrium annulatum]|nr:hypothetical protein HK101_006893 [Irineochytrium annulatum]
MNPGKPGSRRRQRHDNDHFVHHPLVDPLRPFSARDAMPGPPLPRPSSAFTRAVEAGVRRGVMTATPASFASRAGRVGAGAAAEAEGRVGEVVMNRADRRVRREARRGWVDEAVVAAFEGEVLAFLRQFHLADETEEEEEDVEDAKEEVGEVVVVPQDEGSVRPIPVRPMHAGTTAFSLAGLSSSLGTVIGASPALSLMASPALSSLSTSVRSWAGAAFSSSSTSLESAGPDEGGWIEIDDSQNEARASSPTSSDGGAGGWVRLEREEDGETGGCGRRRWMKLVISDKALRLVVHVMCKYYGLTSFSEDRDDGVRVTHVHVPDCMLVLRPTPAKAMDGVDDEGGELDKELKEEEAARAGAIADPEEDEGLLYLPKPERSFTDFLFGE